MLSHLILVKVPNRITLGGGSSDLQCYYRKFGGFVVTVAIDRFIYVLVKDRFESSIRASYSTTEIVDKVSDLKHPAIREGLKLLDLKDHLEIVSAADMPSETGLGSSGSFAVGLLTALHGFKGEHPSRLALAEESTNLTMTLLKEPCGCQDTYIAALGGFQCLEIGKDGQVKFSPLNIKAETVRELEHNLLFFYTGLKRCANTVLKSHRAEDDYLLRVGLGVKETLERGKLEAFAQLQNCHWNAKKMACPEVSNPQIDRWIKLGLDNGALGAKLTGAGGGGFLTFYCENGKDRLRKVMAGEGLKEVCFGLGLEGSKVIIDL